MMPIQEEAIRKIREERTDLKSDRLTFMRSYIADTVCSFCEQSVVFAEAVMDEKKTLAGCLKSLGIEKEHYLSDFEVYSRAARYFFPDAIVEWTMKLRPPKNQTSGKILDLSFEDLIGL